MTASTASGLTGRVIEGRYQLAERIGAGGLGEVYRATHVRMSKDFAVKVLHRSLAKSAEVKRRFEHEARALSRLSHPRCVQVTDFGLDGELPYLVMELLEGPRLDDVMEAGEITLARGFDIVREMLAGLGHAHAQGVVHRDLKPQNVVLVDDPLTKMQQPKILDFGLARIVHPDREEIEKTAAEAGGRRRLERISRLTAQGVIVGTPPYMAPEQIAPRDGATLGPRTDLYSVGVLLYELCTGRRPFEGEDVIAVLDGHLREEPTPPSSLRPQLPAAVDRVILRALAKHPRDRHADAAALASDLASIAPLVGGRQQRPTHPPPGSLQAGAGHSLATQAESPGAKGISPSPKLAAQLSAAREADSRQSTPAAPLHSGAGAAGAHADTLHRSAAPLGCPSRC